ncbi:unnamed protein product [Parnassius apollo]|uniref:(apollo) hypothetical protein n=1 Tax=Parnassius apollo TaxID=110799 RepID=A0A8S3X971_PARAO|nr:unnamed protein product [Parnassius apollo]
MTSFQSNSETVTAGNNMEMTGPINNDQQQQNYSEALLDPIFSGPSGPTLEFVPAHLSKEQSTVPVDYCSDYSVH